MCTLTCFHNRCGARSCCCLLLEHLWSIAFKPSPYSSAAEGSVALWRGGTSFQLFEKRSRCGLRMPDHRARCFVHPGAFMWDLQTLFEVHPPGFCTARHAAAFLLVRTSPGEKVVVFICLAIMEEFEPVPNAAFSPETTATWLSMRWRLPVVREGLPGPAKSA